MNEPAPDASRPVPGPPGLPQWWEPLLSRAAASRTEDFTTLRAPAVGGRSSAVLVLLGEQRAGEPDVLVLQRAASMRNHAGQPAFPGGAADPDDAGPAATALREAGEEVDLDPSSATVLTLLPQMWIPVSNFIVTPVLAWWHAPHPVHARQASEVARVERVTVADLTEPANRLRVRHPNGWVAPGFAVGGMLIWGFTAGVISALLDMAGWTRPWQPGRLIELPGSTAPVGAVPSGAPDEVVP
ncbi:NUDIX hydrolase [Mangrovihabitans endophyticus]|uniref:Coenzyme A pyrophosphatase n=1 Tax=Mangrovihabitans endophyticus TaxID=1751298 RepID=A0A8J3C3N2_9ACTN|nr:CoA pyrophosphatase [Mangrovihabitans endophyticus]GGL03507.1 coenzyme A pyrophosphatase [Mangrovihabitans endophyticus]